ncbi:MAG TPA: RNA polymerase sigma factor [Planctomycetota bacterium]|nr:RNA polymerase sigma factor [Planctomycetota bacterium]
MAGGVKGLAAETTAGAGSNGGAPVNWRALDEGRLLSAMAEGHSGAFDELFSRHSGAVLAFLSRLTTTKCDPEDLLQETFLRVLTHARDFRPGAAFRPWLFTIARNVAYNSLQKRKLRAEVEVQTDFRSPAVPPSVHASSAMSASSDPSARMQSQEQKTKLLKALEELPDAQREILVLIVFDNFSYEEAAAITGDSEGTLRSRVFHALKKLRDRLKEPV